LETIDERPRLITDGHRVTPSIKWFIAVKKLAAQVCDGGKNWDEDENFNSLVRF
jgi:hypothetical protein